MDVLDQYLSNPTEESKNALAQQVEESVNKLLTRTELAEQLGLTQVRLRRLLEILQFNYPSEDDLNQFKRIGQQYGSWTVLQVALVRYRSERTNALIHRLRIQPPPALVYTGPEAITEMVKAPRKGIVRVTGAAYALCACVCGTIATVPTTDLTSGRSVRCVNCRNKSLSDAMKTAHQLNKVAR
jgi:hypothetical protein